MYYHQNALSTWGNNQNNSNIIIDEKKYVGRCIDH